MKPNWFVAVPVPAAAWLPEVLADLPSTCRGFAVADVHMTLAFLGAMAPERADAVIAVMQQLKTAPLRIRLGPLMGLPSPERASAFSFSVTDGREAAEKLIGNTRARLLEAGGARPDDRPPLAHITIARPMRNLDASDRRAALARALSVQPPWMALDLTHLALYTWSDDRRLRQFQISYRQPL